MTQPLLDLQFDVFAEDLLAERSARPLIIVGSSKVDFMLQEILRRYFLPKISKASDPDELLEGDTPLSTFSARIKICCRLGLIDGTLRRGLDRLRLLRNLCAHSVVFDVSRSPVRDHVTNLKNEIMGRRSFRLTKERYFGTGQLHVMEELHCVLLTVCVLLEAIREKTLPTRGNKSTLRIASR